MPSSCAIVFHRLRLASLANSEPAKRAEYAAAGLVHHGMAAEKRDLRLYPQDEEPLEPALEARISSLSAWIREHASYCAEEQAHLDEGTRERAYWHHGYLVALEDVRRFLARRSRARH